MKNTNFKLKFSEAASLEIKNTLSKFMIGKKISSMIRNKTYRRIFLVLWILKSVVFYWFIF